MFFSFRVYATFRKHLLASVAMEPALRAYYWGNVWCHSSDTPS